jgi:uncharacterized protein (DUF2236 family)
VVKNENDIGFFPSDSMVWKLHGQPSSLLGGLRALLTQALHPLAMAGVRDHSNYKAAPWARYRRTRNYIVATTFGTVGEAKEVASRVLDVHNRINGTDSITGKHYDAHSPELLLWIQNCLVDSFIASYERYEAKLSDDEVAQYLTEMARAGELVGLPAEMCPKTRDDLSKYFEDIKSELCISESVREGASIVLSPPMFFLLKPFWWILSAGALDLLPPYALELYGYKKYRYLYKTSRIPNRIIQFLGTAIIGQGRPLQIAYQREGVPIKADLPSVVGSVQRFLRKKIE